MNRQGFWLGFLLLFLFQAHGNVHGQIQERNLVKKHHRDNIKWGKKLRKLPNHAKHIYVEDSTEYWYKGGHFFQAWWGKYVVVPPPIGYELLARPAGYLSLEVEDAVYFYYNGMFLIRTGRTYEIVPPPEGAELYFLPKGERYKLQIDGHEFVWLYGIYYEKIRSETGYPAYKVIGSMLPSSLVANKEK